MIDDTSCANIYIGMYKYFAIIFYVLPIILILSFKAKEGDFLNDSIFKVFLLCLFFYILFPLVMLVKNFLQIKKDNSIRLFLSKYAEKLPRLPFSLSLIAPLIKMSLVMIFILISIYTSVFLFTYILHTTYESEINFIVDVYKNRSPYSTQISNILNKVTTIEKNFYEDKKIEFFSNNKVEYNFDDKSAKFIILHSHDKPDYEGFNNKYGYRPDFYFSKDFVNNLSDGKENIDITDHPAILNDVTNSTGDLIWFFQDEKIVDFYVNSYDVKGFDLPVFVGIVETDTRDISFLLYPAHINNAQGDYVLSVTTSNNRSFSNSRYCDYDSSGDKTISFKCINRSLESSEKVDYDTWDKVYSISLDVDGNTKLTTDRIEQ